MTRATLPTLVLLLAAALPAQVAEQDELIERRDRKLASEFLKKADWITDFERAKAAAKKADELIFAYFTRSFAA